MKVHKQKTKNRLLTMLMCLSIIATTLCSPLMVHASADTVNKIVIDVALTKTGVIANTGIGTEIEASVRADMRSALIAYDEWIDENNITDISIETFYEFCTECEKGTAGSSIINYEILGLLDEYAVKNWIGAYRLGRDNEIDFVEMTTGEKATDDKNVELSDDFVDYVRKKFDEYAETEAPYVYVNTMSPEDISPLWFTDVNQYNILKEYLTNSEYYMYLGGYQENGTKYLSTGTDNTFKFHSIYLYRIKDDFGIYRNQNELGSSTHTIDVSIVNTQWKPCTADYFSSAIGNISNVNNSGHWNENHSLSTIYCDFDKNVQQRAFMWLVTNDGRDVRVFKTLDDYKFFTVGKEPYYVTERNGNYTDTDNSVKVGGTYLNGSGYTYSHDSVQNQIDNSENVDNSVVNNIVNNTTTNIINSYNESLVGGGGSNDDSGGGGGLGSILDGLGSIVSAVAEVVGFLLGVIADIIGLIGEIFNVIFEGLKSLTSIFSGFAGLMGEIFTFIPEELIKFLVLSVEAVIGIAVWRKFSK